MTFQLKNASPLDLANYRVRKEPDQGFLGAYNTAKRAFQLNETTISEAEAVTEAWQPIIDEMNARDSGKTFANPGLAYRIGIFNDDMQQNSYDGYVKAIMDEIETNDLFGDLRGVVSNEQVREQAATLARDSREEFLKTTQNNYTTGAAIGTFAGAARSMLEDPVLVGSMVFGGAQGLWRMAFQEAAIGAGSEAIIQTKVKDWYKTTGQEYTDEQFWTAVKYGGMIGFATPFVIRGTGKTIQAGGRIANLSVDQMKSGIAALRASGVPQTKEGRVLEELAADVEADNAINPLQKTDDAELPAQQEHKSRVQAASQAVEHGQAPLMPEQPKVQPKAPDSPYDADNLDNTIYKFDPNELEVDAELFQFKAGGDEFGVTERLQGITQWDPVKSGQVLVFEYRDGRRFIADGHQRMGLAKRIKASDPKQDVRLYGVLLRESDGYTVADARVIAAVKNIAEGTGTAMDAAKILKDAPQRIGELPPRSRLVQQAQGLVMLSDNAFGAVINNVIPSNYGAIVGRLIPEDQGMQDAAIAVLSKTEPANEFQAESIVRQVMDAGAETRTQDTLFGEEVITESFFAERAKVLDRAVKQLRKDKAAFASLVRNQKSLEAEGNQLAQSANQRRADNDSQAIGLLQALANRKGPLSDSLTAAARTARESGSYGPATDGFIEAVRRSIQEGDFDRLAAGDVGRTLDDTAQSSPRAAEPEQDVTLFDEPDGVGVQRQAEQLENDLLPTRREGMTDDELALDDLRQLLERTDDEAVIDAHPAVVDALERSKAVPETHLTPGYLSGEWITSRQFKFDDVTINGYVDGIARLYEDAKRLAWGKKGAPVEPVKFERKAVIVLGPPAAGKSSVADPVAKKLNAAVIDADEAKKVLPEYGGGIGANAVHEESSYIMNLVEAMALQQGVNVVIPKVGGSAGSIKRLISRLRDSGYDIDIMDMSVRYTEARRRMYQRFVATGRLIAPDYIRAVGDNPGKTYDLLKKEGLADGYTRIDNNVGLDETKPIIEDTRNLLEGTELRLPESGRESGEIGARPDGTEVSPERTLEAQVADQIPVGVEKVDGEEIPITMTRQELLDEIKQDKQMLDRLRDCAV